MNSTESHESLRVWPTLLVALLVLPQPLAPAVIVVDGSCTLVDAITAANSDGASGGCPAGSGADEIQLTEDVTLTEVDNDPGVPNGLPRIVSEITIQGGAFTIGRDFGAPRFRLFEVMSNGTLGLENVTVTGGHLSSGQHGGAIRTVGLVTLENSVVSDNYAYGGGGISAVGTTVLNNSTVSGNQSRNGGGIMTVGTATLTNSTVWGNHGDYYGGGIANYGSLTLVNSTVSNNAAVWGSGIQAQFGDTTLINSTVNNTVYSGYYTPYAGSVILINSIAACSGENPFTDGGNNFTLAGCPGTPVAVGVDLAGLADNGGRTLTHALLPGSAAINGAGDCGLARDQRGVARDSLCDGGAFELGLQLSLVGFCPGAMTVSVTNATADSTVELFQSPAGGFFEILDGACAGTELWLESPVSRALVPTGPGGDGSLVLDLAEPDCGNLLQGLDLGLCRVSRVEPLVESCVALALGHTGSGADPVASPPNSPGCPESTYLTGEIIELTAGPDPGWKVAGWSGTDDDSSTSVVNSLTMPGADHTVSVDYAAICYALTLDHTGSGLDPTAVPVGNGTTWTENAFASDAGSTRAADLDGDGDYDTYGPFINKVLWWENPLGDGTSWVERKVSGSPTPISAFAADLDGDGDNDIVVASQSGGEISWQENTIGDGTAWSRHDVDSDVAGAFDVIALDLDGDGDSDVVGAARGADEVAWWENTLGDGTAWSKHTVGSNFDAASSVDAEDVDGDGDIDVLATAERDNEIAWWENTLGDGTAWSKHLVDANLEDARAVYAADVDGDGDIDVLGTGIGAAALTWWENTLGDGTAWNERALDPDFPTGHDVLALDMDSDGDTDVLGANGELRWWENTLGDGSAWNMHPVPASGCCRRSSNAVDVDGDRDIDVLSRESWLENTYTGTCPAGMFNVGDLLALTAAPDPGWEVDSWSGTNDDASTETTNFATMPPEDHTASVNYLERAAIFALSIEGSCPGEATISVTTPRPDRGVVIFAGTDQGTSYVPWGPCGGTELDLAFGRQWRSLTTNENGEASMTATLSSAWCGRYLQGLDRQCSTSNLAQFP